MEKKQFDMWLYMKDYHGSYLKELDLRGEREINADNVKTFLINDISAIDALKNWDIYQGCQYRFAKRLLAELQ